MCRLLGAVSTEITDYELSLALAPRSLAALSPDHPHGWGLALHDGRRGWEVYRNTTCAREDDRFRSLAGSARGRFLVAHVRNRTVGPTSFANTHPFRRDGWVFAHNGTIKDLAFLDRRTSGERRREVEGDTDSERFFAFLLTAIDRAGDAKNLDAALASACSSLTAQRDAGAANFLLSDGKTMFAHRWGRTLHTLERGDKTFLIASEKTTDEAWTEVAEGTLLRVDRGARPTVTTLLSPARRLSACG